jgi:hypothetical protein
MPQMQESTILAILVEVARGENVKFDRLMTAIVETINLAGSQDAPNMLKKAIDMIQASAKHSQLTPVKSGGNIPPDKSGQLILPKKEMSQ